MMSLHYILVELVYCSGLDFAGQESGVAWVEQSVVDMVWWVVEVIKLNHCCIGDSTLGVVHSSEVVVEHKVEMTSWLAGSDIEMQRTKDDLNWIHENYQNSMTISNRDRIQILVNKELSRRTSE